MISYGIFETARNGGLFCVVRITSRRYGKWKNSEKGITRVNGNTKLLKCHFIFTKLSIGSNKVVVLSTTNFKPEGYFSSLLCHSNCMRFSTLDELLFKIERYNIFFPLKFSYNMLLNYD